MSFETKFGKAEINNKGYCQIISSKKGYKGKQLHRLIYEDYYGVSLLSFVYIHHIDGNKSNNNINNLQPMYASDHQRMHNLGKNNHNYGKKMSDKTKRKISEKVSGENHPLWGKHHSDETKKKISKIHKGKTISDVHRKKISEANKGWKMSDEEKEKLSIRMSGKNNPMYGKKFSQEEREKLSKLYSGEGNPRWGTSIIDEWGGIWFLKEMKKQVKTMSKITEYTGISRGVIYSYLKNRGLKWVEI